MTDKIIFPSRLHHADEDTDALSWETAKGYEVLDIPPPSPSPGEPIRAGCTGSSWIKDFLFCLVVMSILVSIYLVVIRVV